MMGPRQRTLLDRALPFLRDEAAKYEDDGSNEPLELIRDIEAALQEAEPVVDGWHRPDVDGCRSIQLDDTGCMTELALFIANPRDGGPNIRQGRYDGAFGFIDSTTGMRINIDAFSISPAALQAALGEQG